MPRELPKIYQCSDNYDLEPHLEENIIDPEASLAGFLRGLREASYHISTLSSILVDDKIKLESGLKQSLPLSNQYISRYLQTKVEPLRNLLDANEDKSLILVPAEIIKNVEMAVILTNIASTMIRFTGAHNRAAFNHLNHIADSSQGMSTTTLTVANKNLITNKSNISEVIYFAKVVSEDSSISVNYDSTIPQLNNIATLFSELIDTIDPGRPEILLDNLELRSRFTNCLFVIQYFLDLIDESWKEYKQLCRSKGQTPNSKIANVMKTATRNFLKKFVIYDFPKALGMEIPEEVRRKYETDIPELLALSDEDKKDFVKVDQARRAYRARLRQEKLSDEKLNTKELLE